MLSKEDILWLLLRYRNEDNQVTPGWKGFFYEITKETADAHIVGYLPTICQSPTKIDIVLEVLKQYEQKAEALNKNGTDLVLDHEIYAKAVEILMIEKLTDLRTFINIRMGGFHMASVFLGVIEKRFKDAGLKDLIIVSRLLGEGQVDQMLKGKEYNNDMRIHFYIVEAISRKKFETITTNTVTAMVLWTVQNQKLSGHLEVQQLSKRVCQNNRKRARVKFAIKIFSLQFIAFSQNFILHLQNSKFLRTLSFGESQLKRRKPCV